MCGVRLNDAEGRARPSISPLDHVFRWKPLNVAAEQLNPPCGVPLILGESLKDGGNASMALEVASRALLVSSMS